MTELQKLIQENIDTIWRQISKVDSIGRAKLIEECGGDELKDLFSGARNLAKLMTTARRALDSASGSMQCERINPIYNTAAHATVCTDAASATAFGFLLFLILGLSTMTLISLRASWLRNIEEEKVYHDESEVAENMILDEHEEYLAYISRYKHEWQEYNGFETSAVPSNEDSYDGEDSEDSLFLDDESDEGNGDGDGYNGSEERSESSDVSNPRGLDVEIFPASLHAPSVDDGARECAIDEISFPSLSGHKSEESGSIGENELLGVPTPLLPPPENPDYIDAPEEILIPSTEVTLKEKSKTVRRGSRSGLYAEDSGLSNFFDKYGIDPHAHEKELQENINHHSAPGSLDDRYDAPTEASDPPGITKRAQTNNEMTRARSAGNVSRRPSGDMARARSAGNEPVEGRRRTADEIIGFHI